MGPGGSRLEIIGQFLTSHYVWVLIPVTAIVVGGIHSILREMHRNQERLAMIEKGMHPDGPSLSKREE